MARGRQVTNRELTVKIEGLRDFREALKLVADEYPDAVKKANNDLATGLVKHAQKRGRSYGGVVAKGSRSLKATNAAAYSAILGGTTGSKTDRAVFFGAEFGGKRRTQGKKIPVNARGPRKLRSGFKPWRGNQWGGWSGGPGYFLHPTIREEGPAAIEEYKQRLLRLERRAFPD